MIAKSILVAALLTAPVVANAAVVTSFDTQGTAVILDGAPDEQAITVAADRFYETLVSAGTPPTSAAATFGEIAEGADGIRFQNAVAGYGSASNGTSSTLIKQTVTNDTGLAQSPVFTGVIDQGIIGLWVPDLANCSARALFACPARDTGDLGFPAPSVFGGPAEASMLISLRANGALIFEISLFVGVGEGSESGDNIVLSLADGEMALNGFRRLGGPEDGSLLFAWDDTPIEPSLGFVGRGETLDVEFSVTTSFATFGDCGGSISQCVAAVSCYGDPIGGGSDGTIGSRFRQVTARSSLFASRGSAPAPTCDILVADVDVPEPAPFGLLALGLSLGIVLRRRQAVRP